MLISLIAVEPHFLIRQDSMVLMSVRKIIALNMSATSMSSLDINGTMAITNETNSRWLKRGTRLSPALRTSVVMPISANLMRLAISLSRSQ